MSAIDDALAALGQAIKDEIAARPAPAPAAFLSPRAFSERTGLSRATVTRLLAKGEVRSTRAGRRVLIPVEEVGRLVAGG